MLDFIFILFLSKTVLLTSEFVDISSSDSSYVLNLQEPISAITSGASIQIDVTEMLSKSIDRDIIKTRKNIANMFSGGSIEAILSNATVDINLKYEGGNLISNDSIKLALYAENIPTDTDFNVVTLKSSVNLERVKVYWKNYKK
jgi:hypothetical protein